MNSQTITFDKWQITHSFQRSAEGLPMPVLTLVGENEKITITMGSNKVFDIEIVDENGVENDRCAARHFPTWLLTVDPCLDIAEIEQSMENADNKYDRQDV